jgi:hypothetical protein
MRGRCKYAWSYLESGELNLKIPHLSPGKKDRSATNMYTVQQDNKYSRGEGNRFGPAGSGSVNDSEEVQKTGPTDQPNPYDVGKAEHR